MMDLTSIRNAEDLYEVAEETDGVEIHASDAEHSVTGAADGGGSPSDDVTVYKMHATVEAWTEGPEFESLGEMFGRATVGQDVTIGHLSASHGDRHDIFVEFWDGAGASESVEE